MRPRWPLRGSALPWCNRCGTVDRRQWCIWQKSVLFPLYPQYLSNCVWGSPTFGVYFRPALLKAYFRVITQLPDLPFPFFWLCLQSVSYTHLDVYKRQWIGFAHFQDFFGSSDFWRLIKNTVLISVYSLIFGFPVPIILAIVLNEIRTKWFKKVVQTVSYLPYFISIVVVCGMIKDFLQPSTGIINHVIKSVSYTHLDVYKRQAGKMQTVMCFMTVPLRQMVSHISVMYWHRLSRIWFRAIKQWREKWFPERCV